MSLLSSRRTATLGLTGALAVGALAMALPAGASSATKPAPQVPAAAKAAPAVHGSGAAATVHTGSPTTSGVTALASQDGACDVGDLCLYYVSSQAGYGSGYDTAHNDPNLFNNHFIFAGAGQRATVGSNAESYWNRDLRTYAYVCTGLNGSGSCGWLAPNTYGNLNSTYYNRSQSVVWGDSTN